VNSLHPLRETKAGKVVCTVTGMTDSSRIPPTSRSSPRALRLVDLVRPHWKALTLALVAVLGETLTSILEPWPIKVVVDNILQSKPLPEFWAGR